ncbi:LamG-like jellyroll fold domain-containing protein, partial [Agrococcus casei]
VPYAILAGNHDVRNASNSVVDTDYDLANEPFLDTFPVDRAEAHDTFGGADPTGLNRFSIFEAEGQQYLVLSLNWRVSDATLAWASDVLDAHSELPTIIASHDIISIQNDGVTGETSPNGERLWDALINDNDQVFLTLNGHYHGSAKVERQNAAGNTVTQILTDHQMAYEGGNGYMNLLEFDITNGEINVNTLSPWVVSKPEDKLTSYDTPVLTGANEQYSIPVDFESRFAGFTTVEPAQSDLSARAIEILTEGFNGAPESAHAAAGNEHDYVQAEGTLAHWQLTGDAGEVAEGQLFDDLAGDSDLYREAIDASGSATAQPGNVTIVDSAQTYSPSQQAVCFNDSSRERFSYLTTAPDAPVNNADLSGGYTIETFLMLDDEWAADVNGWSKALTRSGNRSLIEGMPWSQWDYTASPAALGISNLREFQWTEIGEDATRGDKTNWSGEILTGTWSHVALVNDAETETTVMYVNGAPVLRTAQDTYGMSFNEGMPWILGSDWVDDGATNGWHGCIGETRIVDRPLEAAEWLTA